jgi:PAS domain S-box-containing protein
MMRVLYVDDEEDLLDLAKEFLESSPDVVVETAPRARDGLQRVREGGIDAVVSDYMMPEVDGLAFLKELRSAGDRTPFILFSGKGREEVVIDALNNGVDFFVQKGGAAVPMFAELAHKVRQAVERRRTDEALKESERRFRQVIETLPVGLWLADKDGTLLLGNSAGQKIWEANPHVGQDGYGVFKAWRLPSREPIRPDDWALGHAVNEGLATENELLEIEAFDGSHKSVLNWAFPTKDEKGAVTGAFVINQDISVIVRAEAALQEREERYRNLVRHSSDPIFSIGPDEEYLLVNESFARIVGKEPEELIGHSPLVLFPGPQAEKVVEHMRRVFRTRETEEIELTLTLQDGQERHFLTVLDPIIGEDDAVLSVSCISKDITERMRTEEVLRKSEELNRAILEHAGIGMAFWSQDGRLLYINPLASTHLGGLPGEFAGMTVSELFEPEEADRFMARITEAVASPKPREYEDHIAAERMSGWLLSIYNRVLDPSSNVVGVQLFSLDITERKKMESELQDTNRKLNLLSNITMHDISNQLAAMNGLLELARTQDDRVKAERYIDKALVASDRIGAMIHFSRDYESIGVLAPSWLNIRMIVDRAWAAAKRGEVQLINEADPTLELRRQPNQQGVLQPVRQRPEPRGHGDHHPLPDRAERERPQGHRGGRRHRDHAPRQGAHLRTWLRQEPRPWAVPGPRDPGDHRHPHPRERAALPRCPVRDSRAAERLLPHRVGGHRRDLGSQQVDHPVAAAGGGDPDRVARSGLINHREHRH